ncbi:MAG: molybdopterin-dependent oxidoreductase, partial [SAR324 cluster bacterium]|nr:molybdopterin-dependent oxidoreductase [SAR324 cluster bacterium]
RLQGDPDHPFTHGFLCRKMRHYADRIYSADRILYPQIRTGIKGNGEFKRITWADAWEILVSRLKEIKEMHGSQALLPYSYAGNMGHISRWAGEPFFHRFGASRLKRTICSTAAGAAWQAHCGKKAGSAPETAADSRLIILWGINVKTTNIHFWPIIQQSRKKGGRLVVIDPYRNKTAKAADLYLPVQPGGDTALALGALKQLLENGFENRPYIEKRTSGFSQLRNYVSGISWETIERSSGLSKKQIETFAQLLAANPRTFIRIGIGLTRNTGGAMSVRAILSLAASLGLFDGEKGRGVLGSSRAFYGNTEKLVYSSLAEKPMRQVNMVQLGQALTSLKPSIQGLFVFNSNPLSVAPDSSRVRKGLEREDLFTIVHEQLMTPTARYADLLLPATTSFENSDIYTAYGHFQMGVTQPVIPPLGEALSNFDLFQTLAGKMGYTEAPFLQTVEERIKDYLSGISGIDKSIDTTVLEAGQWISSIHADPEHSSNREMFQFVSPETDPGVPALPCIMPTLEFGDPDLLSRYPLKLITPPATHLLNSTFGECYPQEIGKLLIHPQDAARRNISTGDQVRLKNHRGETIREARVTEDTQPGLVVAEGIYWENVATEHTAINDLTSQKTTDLGEGSTFHESLVEVVRKHSRS